MCLALLLSNIVLAGPLEAEYSWGALDRKPDTQLLTFIKSSKFNPGETYRILRAHDGKIGMYQLVQHNARLDSEFFPESIGRNSWPDVTKYSQFLRNRRVDYVIIFRTYDREWRTNEHQLLPGLNKQGPDGCDEGRVGVQQIREPGPSTSTRSGGTADPPVRHGGNHPLWPMRSAPFAMIVNSRV